MSKPKLIVMGHARHGKDTVSEMLRDRYGFSFISSSLFCAEKILYPVMKKAWLDYRKNKGVGPEPAWPDYEAPEFCFDDRANHRAFWYDSIREFNRPDPTSLGRAIFKEHDVYCGIRHHSEFQALRNAGAFDMAIWVDAADRVPPEPRSSCSVEPWMADFILDNNGTLEDLVINLESLHHHQVGKYRR